MTTAPRPRSAQAFIALGTNLGDRLLNLAEARRRVGRLGALTPGPVLETEPLLPPEDPAPQPRYLNSVDRLETRLPPLALFLALKRVEREMGRVVTTRWAPRLIDLDLVLFGDAVLDVPGLTVPHPRLHERRFVLEPLARHAPGLVHPRLGLTVRQLLARVSGR